MNGNELHTPPPDSGNGACGSSWGERYGVRHRLEWIKEFPAGIAAPKKVRIYRRAGHFILQWWDKAEKRNLCERINGDLVAAIARARQIEERLEHFRSSGSGIRKTQHAELVEQFHADLHCRADAGEIDPRTVVRYGAAIKHYLAFVTQPNIHRQFPHISLADRTFALGFMAYLRSLQVPPNGHPNGQERPMRRPDYIVDVVRAMYDWAADPQRGKLIPAEFRNPFLRRGRQATTPVAVSVGEPDITIDMAVSFLRACDAYQLRLFAPMAIYGLRAGEPCMLFHEHFGGGWLNVPCLPELAFYTKGRREKRLPILPCLDTLVRTVAETPSGGLIYLRRGVVATSKAAPLIGASLKALVQEFQRRSVAAGIRTAADRRRIRDQLLHDAGGMNYDHIATEFDRVAQTLKWPQAATLKDFRHLVATCLENAGMPEHYRKFLLGQSPGRAAIVTYTHLNAIREQFDAAVGSVIHPLVEAIERRIAELNLHVSTHREGSPMP